MFNSPLDLNGNPSNSSIPPELRTQWLEYLKNQQAPTNTGDVADIIARGKSTGGISGILQGVGEFISSPSGQKILGGLSKNPYTQLAYLGQADTSQTKGDALKAAYLAQKDKNVERIGHLVEKEEEGKQKLKELKQGKDWDFSNAIAEMVRKDTLEAPHRKMAEDIAERETKLKEAEIEAKKPTVDLEQKKTTAETGSKLGLKGQDLADYMASGGQGKVKDTFLGSFPLIGGLFKKASFTPTPSGITPEHAKAELARRGKK